MASFVSHLAKGADLSCLTGSFAGEGQATVVVATDPIHCMDAQYHALGLATTPIKTPTVEAASLGMGKPPQ